MIDRVRQFLVGALSVAISVFTIYEVNYGALSPLSRLSVFCLLGSALCFLMYPIHRKLGDVRALRVVDILLAAAIVSCCSYLIYQGNTLAARAGKFTETDFAVAIAGTALILEATRRSIGWALPILAGSFLAYALYGSSMPDWLFPHRGYSVERIAAQCFLRTEGVFSIAMSVMFTYVFLFVVFGAFLEISGATQFIVDFAKRVFGRSPGGPAKVAVLASGLMGSLSGSAVANAVTTGTFTIPMMRSAGFKPHIAGGITAAAASGGALVPPVMGAGAYMMLELIDDVTFVQIARAALVPAILYYLSILLFVHFYSRRVGADAPTESTAEPISLFQYNGLVFFGALGALITFLFFKTPFRAVTYSLQLILVLTILSPRMAVSIANRAFALLMFGGVTGIVAYCRANWNQLVNTEAGWAQTVAIVLRPDDRLVLSDFDTWTDAAIPGMLLVLLIGLLNIQWRPMILDAFSRSARGGVSLVSASACVGVVIGVVSLTGVGTAFPNAIIPLAERSLFLALLAIMGCSIVLGMGLPSAVCYLLMATLIGPVLNKLGVPPLAAHLFIFYFGMMSMVTPPVALAAYASAGIAESKIMPTAFAAFRFALVGFTLPFMFVYRPELLLMTRQGDPAALIPAIMQISMAVVGIVALSVGLAGYFFCRVNAQLRTLILIAAAMLLTPDVTIGETNLGMATNITAFALFVFVTGINFMQSRSPSVVERANE
ncbi:MAG: TRAP transporter fused permease subunit [Fuerstiella sp.]|nr:TRAP transporter fused permease subunit [Fuerstiella sp.]